jgi:spore maturation protein A
VNIAWPLLFCGAIIYALLSGDGENIIGYLAQSAAEAIALIFTLAGAYTLWCGVLRIFKSCGAVSGLTRLLSPAIKRLFPDHKDDEDVKGHIATNFAANMMGLGNAATPAGIEAVKAMAKKSDGVFTNAMGMFIVVNCSSLQIIPTTVISLRAQAGSMAAGDIFLPSLVTSFLTTLLSITLAIIVIKYKQKRSKGMANL